MWIKLKKFLTDVFFPKFCLSCQKEGEYLCQDCQALLEISGFHQKHSSRGLADLYFALPYKSPLIKNLIQKFKYEPFVKELAGPLSFLIISHFQLLEETLDFNDFILLPAPLSEKRLKWRGFNQAEEIGKELAEFFKIPLVSGCLRKGKDTLAQVELSDEERKENMKGVFSIKNKELINNKKILLIDDVYTTGATMEECARSLKGAGAKAVIGVVVARG